MSSLKNKVSAFLEARNMRRLANSFALLGALAVVGGCGDPQPAINRVGTSVVEKSAFTGSWYMGRTIVGMEFEATPLGFVGENSGDPTGGFAGYTVPRIRWVIDENYLYAYRDYEIIGDPEDPQRIRGNEDPNFLGQPVAAFRISSHFDIRRDYDATTGEEINVLLENTSDRHWYERQFMRVDWSTNLISGWTGVSAELSELFGQVHRDPTSLFVQNESDYPAEYRPQYHFMSCGATEDSCDHDDRDFFGDYDQNQLYSMSFVTQEILSPEGPFCGYTADTGSGFPECASVSVWIRTSFLRVSDRREYAPVSWTNDRIERAGIWRLDRETYDRSTHAGDPSYGFTDFTNQAAVRHNIWRQWYQHDAQGHVAMDGEGRAIPLPYADRPVRQISWYTSREMPAHLIRPGFELVAEWNQAFMGTVRQLKQTATSPRPLPVYPEVTCQTADPDAYCYCQRDPQDEATVLNPTCPGHYEPFETPQQAMARGVQNPFDCYVAVPDCTMQPATTGGQPLLTCTGATPTEPDFSNPSVASGATDRDFYGWYNAQMQGTECVNVLHVNSCNLANQAGDGTWPNLDCQNRGDIRYKLPSYVDVPGTPFLGVAQMRGDPISGEIITGDTNIGGPAANVQRTGALQTYDLMHNTITEREFLTGEDVRAYEEALDRVDLPAAPRIDFSVALQGNFQVDPNIRASIDAQMQQAMSRAEMLRGPEARAATFQDRITRLAGTSLERRLLDNEETFALAGMDSIPDGMTPSDLDESTLDRISPFRNQLGDRFAREMDFQRRLAMSSMHMPTEYTDDSVMNYVTTHLNFGRAQLEFQLSRRLFHETEVHEMGHCLGMRHNFAGTSDPDNYFDQYYDINTQLPLPDPRTFDTDGTLGLNSTEQNAWETAYEAARQRRQLAGISQWMNASVMDYTPHWYERLNGAGRYDMMTISFGYGDIVDIYHNTTGMPVAQINPRNTAREPIKYYQGGEACSTDNDCPYSTNGSHSSELLPANMAAGITQHCVANPNVGTDTVCSGFDADELAITSTEWVPVDYDFCTDERWILGTSPTCAQFDAGDSFREIVRTQAQSYERGYLFSGFRRYRYNYSFNTYFTYILRWITPLVRIYENLVYRYSTDPEYRDTTGSFGFYDHFLATADIVNMFGRMMSQPGIGTYTWNAGWQRYERTNVDPTIPDAQLALNLGPGRFFNSVYQRGLTGINRIERVGSVYDAVVAAQLLSARNFGGYIGDFAIYYGADTAFFTNLYDIFPNEVEQIFAGAIAGHPEQYMPRVTCDQAAGARAFPGCDNPRLQYMDFYYGDCSRPENVASHVCRGNQATTTYAWDTTGRAGARYVLDGGTSFLVQNYAAIYGLIFLPIYYDTSFQDQLFLCIEGRADCAAPAPGSVEYVPGVANPEYVRYTSRRLGLNFLAWKFTPGTGVVTNTSTAFEMVREARDTEFEIRMLQTYRGDLRPGDVPCLCNLSAAEQAELAALGYTIPTAEAQLSAEIDRLDGRLQELEGFMQYLIQLEGTFGIQFPQRFNRALPW